MFRRGNPGRGLTYAQAAARAIALGGKYDGHELPDDINAMTKAAAAKLAGLGLMGVAKDTYPRDGDTLLVRRRLRRGRGGRRDRQVDARRLSRRRRRRHRRQSAQPARADQGRQLPRHRATRCQQKSVYDPQYGVALARRFHHNKPLTILDIPATMQATRSTCPIPETPVGARGVGEPPVGAGSARC